MTGAASMLEAHGKTRNIGRSCATRADTSEVMKAKNLDRTWPRGRPQYGEVLPEEVDTGIRECTVQL